jgi:hypothetical protein
VHAAAHFILSVFCMISENKLAATCRRGHHEEIFSYTYMVISKNKLVASIGSTRKCADIYMGVDSELTLFSVR